MSFLSFLGGLFGIGPTQRTITISKSATNSGLPFIIGEARLKGLPVYTHISRENGPLTGNNWDFKFDPRPSHGDEEQKSKREWLHRIDVYAQGAITGYQTFFVDSDPHTSARFGTRPYFRTAGFYGSDTQTAFQWGAVTSARNTSHPGVGVAYSVSRFYAHGKYPKYKSEPNIEAVVQGVALFDPRNVLHIAGDISTYDYSENPALGLLRYLTADTGAEWPIASLHQDSFKVAADFCDAAVTIPTRLTNTTGVTQNRRNIFTGIFDSIANGQLWPDFRPYQVGTTQSRIKASLVLNPENGVKGNAKDILKVMHASLPFSNGQYKIVIEDAVTSTVKSFDDDSIIGNWKIDDGGRKLRMNRATVNFVNKNKKYKDDSVSWPALDSTEYTAYLAADNGEKLHQTFDVDAIPDFYQAKAWAEFKVRHSRASRRVKVDLAPVAALLEYGDVISITSTERGWTDEWYRIERLALKASGDVTVGLVDYDASLYTWVEPVSEPLDDPGDAPFLWDDPIAVTGLSAVAFHEAKNDGTVISGFDVRWDALEDISKVEAVEIAWKLSSDADYSNISGVPAENTSVHLPGLVDNTDYDIRITYRTSLGQISADAVITSQTLSDAGSRISGIADGATSGPALNAGSEMASLNNWYSSSNGAALPPDEWSQVTLTDGVMGIGALRINDNNNNTQSLFSELMPCDPNKVYKISMWARQSGDRRNYGVVAFYDATGAQISTAGYAAGWLSTGAYWYWAIFNNPFPASFTYYEDTFGGSWAGSGVIPPTAVAMRIGGLFSRDGAVGISTEIDLQKYQVEEYLNWGTLPDEDGTKPSDNADVTADTQFTPSNVWNFDNVDEGWVVTNATETLNASYVNLAATTADPIYRSPADLTIDGAANFLIRARIRRTAGAVASGFICFYTISGHGESTSYYKVLPDSTVLNEWVILEWDMSNLDAGGNDWITGTITQIRLDLGAAIGDGFDIDWIVVGRIGSLGDITADNNLWSQTQNDDGNLPENNATEGADYDINLTNAPISDGALNKDSAFTGVTGAWFTSPGNTNEVTVDTEFIFTTETTSPAGGNTILKGTSDDDGGDQFFSDRVPIDPSKTYRATCWVRQPSGTKRNYLLVNFQDDAGVNINNGSVPVSDATGWGSIGSYHYWGLVNVAAPTVWTRYEAVFGPNQSVTTPTGAVYAQVGGLVMRDVFTATILEFAIMAIEEAPTNLWQDLSGTGLPEDNATLSDPYGASWNLLDSDAGPVHAGTSYKYWDKKLIADKELAVGDVLSVSALVSCANVAATNVRITIIYYTSDDVLIKQDNGALIDGISVDVLSVANNSIIPATTEKISVQLSWSTGSSPDMSSRRAMLNRGPVALPYVAPYADGADITNDEFKNAAALQGLPPNMVMDQGDGNYRVTPMGAGRGSCRDAVAVTYTTPWDATNLPDIRFYAGGLSYDSSGTLTGDQAVSFKALSQSATGFTPELELRGSVTTPVARTESAITTVVAGDEYTCTKIASTLEAFDDKYTIQFDLKVYGIWDSGFGDHISASIAVGFYTSTDAGVNWTQRATAVYTSVWGDLFTLMSNLSKTITVDGLGSLSGAVFKIVAELEDNALSQITSFDSVTYSTSTATPITVPATPEGIPDVEYEVLGGLDNV